MTRFRQTISAYKLVLIGILCTAGCDESDEVPENIEDPGTLTFILPSSIDVDHNRSYQLSYNATSDSTNNIRYEILENPDWLEKVEEQDILEGTPGWENKEKSFRVIISATDNRDTIIQGITINVIFTNIICNQYFGDPSKSEYILPFKSGVSSEIMQSYCNPSNSHNNTFAYDFLLDLGEDIVASRGGVAVQVQESFPDGNGVSGEENFVYVQHNDGSVIRYVHLEQNSIPFNEGDSVAQGDVLGKNGLTGGTPIPHLHFELFREFTWSDKRYSIPITFLNAEGDLDNNNGLVAGRTYTAK